jgi:hypothetical protein
MRKLLVGSGNAQSENRTFTLDGLDGDIAAVVGGYVPDDSQAEPRPTS